MKGFGHWGATLRFTEPLHEEDALWILLHVYFPKSFDFGDSDDPLPLVRLHMHSAGGKPEGYVGLSLQEKGKRMVLLRGRPGNRPTPVPQQKTAQFQPLEPGRWHAIELHVKLASKGHAGLVRVWHDATLVLESRHVALLNGTFSRMDHLFLLGTWPGGAPRTQCVYLDDIVLRTELPDQRDRRGNPRLWPYGSRDE